MVDTFYSKPRDAKEQHALDHIGKRGETERSVRFTTYHTAEGKVTICAKCGKEVK